MKSLITLGKQEVTVMNKLKEEYRNPNPEIIELADIRMARTWKRTCPICRETFYSYRNVDKDNSFYPDGYLEPVDGSVNSNGMAKFRITCGSNECYNAEHYHWERTSTFNKGRDSNPDDKSQKPKRPIQRPVI